MKNINKFLISFLFSPLLIKIRGKSILSYLSKRFLNEDERIEMLAPSIYQSLEYRTGNKLFQFVTLLKSLGVDDALSIDFFSNFSLHSDLFESQLGQDCFVDTIFRNKQNGVFIEVGVGNGKHLSNTYFLEKYRSWTGLLCEPSKIFSGQITESRTAILIEMAVLNVTGSKMDFIEVKDAGELSTLKKYLNADTHNREHFVEYAVDTISFGDLCQRYLSGNKIDYLSVDTEGSELEIISAIDFNLFDIGIISVEHNYDQKKINAIRSILAANNYVEIEYFSWDSIFVKRNLIADYTTSSN